MTLRATSNQILVSLAGLIVFVCTMAPVVVFAQTQCNDRVDNQIGDANNYGLGIGKGDKKADFKGVDENNDGVLELEPDPSCTSESVAIEAADSPMSSTGLVPCTDKCTLRDVFQLINNLMSFFFKVLLMPLFVLMIMYAGFSYIKAQGNPGQHVKLMGMFKNMIFGLLIVLCSYLIVRVIITTMVKPEYLMFFK